MISTDEAEGAAGGLDEAAAKGFLPSEEVVTERRAFGAAGGGGTTADGVTTEGGRERGGSWARAVKKGSLATRAADEEAPTDVT